eukprot:7382653-Prymnesium_polylepis.3
MDAVPKLKTGGLVEQTKMAESPTNIMVTAATARPKSESHDPSSAAGAAVTFAEMSFPVTFAEIYFPAPSAPAPMICSGAKAANHRPSLVTGGALGGCNAADVVR